MDLIIVESPTKARTLSKFLGKDFQIEASMGHIRDLPQKRLGIDVEHNFAPDYVVSPDKKEKVKELQMAAQKADKVILATDPDREGEAIAYHLSKVISENSKLKNPNSKFSRITFHEITESAIREALQKPGVINMPLVDAQQARRILDRLVGYKLSPLLWRKIRRGLSAGRVQSVAVRLIVEREREILAFKPVEYWEIVAQLQRVSPFEAKLIKQEIHTKDEADKITARLQTAKFEVTDVQSKEVKRNPYPPFTTSTLQQAASNLFGWSAKKTMQVAQSLYEAGYISYHRTDSTNLAIEAVSSARDYIKSEFGGKYLPENARIYKTKSKVAQEAHEAIRPTDPKFQIQNSNLDRDQKRLYELIWKRFVACQMSEAVSQQTGVDITAAGYTLRATGSKVLFDGWQTLYDKENIKDKKEENEENKELPNLTIGEILELLELVPSQHFTQAAPRYNEASLIKTLEEYGIGRPSTYAPIISTIQDRQYIEKEDKKLLPTALGLAVNDFLMANFAGVLDFKFTAGMEDELDNIANGEKQWVPVIREFYEPFARQLGGVTETAARVKVETETTQEKCPNDGAFLVVRIGKFGKFLACSKFPECKFTKPFARLTGIPCPKCAGEVIIKRTKNKKNFYGCSNYPSCDFASWTKPKFPLEPAKE